MKKYSYNENRKEWSTLVYDGTLNPDGSKHRKRIASKKSSADLEKKVAAFKQQLENQSAIRTVSYTFGEYAKVWLETSKSTKELNTKRMYEIVIRSCFQDINNIPLANITHSHFQMCINQKQDHPRTCQQINITFKQIIKSAVRDRYLPRTAIEDILSDISLPKYKKPEKRPLNALEKQAVEKANLDPRKRAFLSILYYCGLRKSETLALTPEDFDWEKKTVSVSKAWVCYNKTPSIKPYPKSDRGTRIIPLPDVSVEKIKPFVESSTGYIFHGQNTELMTPDAYKRMWESMITELNVAAGYRPHQKGSVRQITSLTAHVFRHNYCTELCYQIPSISTKMIAKLLGDNENMVLDVYSHILEERENTLSAINNTFQV